MPIVFETFEEFAKRQGCSRLYNITVSDRTGEDVQTVLFENGAMSDGQLRHLEPPDNPEALAGLKHQYHKIQLERKKKQYSQLLSAVKTQSEWHALGTNVAASADEQFPNWQEGLDRMCTEIEALQSIVEALDEQLPRNARHQEYERRRAQNRAQSNAAIEQLRKLPVF